MISYHSNLISYPLCLQNLAAEAKAKLAMSDKSSARVEELEAALITARIEGAVCPALVIRNNVPLYHVSALFIRKSIPLCDVSALVIRNSIPCMMFVINNYYAHCYYIEGTVCSALIIMLMARD